MPRTAIGFMLCACVLGWSTGVCAAEFVISPLRVTLSRAVKSTQIEVRNEDTRPLRVQLQAMAWSQDAQGKDRYAETDALLYFPKAMEVPPGGSRIVRLAAKAPPARLEEAYRLFIAELPAPGDVRGGGSASVRVLLRVGVAVFVEPVAPQAAGDIASLALRGGVAEVIVTNTGNIHFAAERLAIVGLDRDGKPLFEAPVRDRYFLAGTTKQLRAQIPPGHCGQLADLEAVVIGSRINLKRRLHVPRADCR
jgi:fimbrial chaperone protein